MRSRRAAVLSALTVVIVILAWFVVHSLSHSIPLQQRADRVVVLKREHKLLLLNGGTVVRTYAISIGKGGLEAKEQQGDHRTPEGLYVVDRHKMDSSFHRAVHVSYPNEDDRDRAQKLGVNPGGDIMIHGIMNGLGWLGSLHRSVDWTDLHCSY